MTGAYKDHFLEMCVLGLQCSMGYIFLNLCLSKLGFIFNKNLMMSISM